MNLWLWLRDRWWARQRALDLEMLWPALKAKTPSLDEARQGFMVHAMQCPCWLQYYGDMDALVGAVWQLS